MTRQSKAVQKKIIARQFTALHLQGQKGPSQTKPNHGKVKTFRYLESIRMEAERLAAEREAEREAERAAQKAASKAQANKGKPAAGKGKPSAKKAA